jgi:hypothetical protein
VADVSPVHDHVAVIGADQGPAVRGGLIALDIRPWYTVA